MAVMTGLSSFDECAFGDYETADGVLSIFAPERKWEVKVPQGDWVLNTSEHPSKTVYYHFFVSSEKQMNFSIFLDKTDRCRSAAGCREMFWKNPGPGYKGAKEVKRLWRNGFAVLQFYIDLKTEKGYEHRHISAHQYRQGYWIDIHLSMVGNPAPDPEIMLRFLDTVTIAAVDETGPETRTDTAPAMDVASATETRIYTMELPDRGPLTLTIPSRWRESPGPSIGNCPTVIFAPPSDDDFQTLVTPIWSGTGDPSFNRPESVKTSMEAELRRMLPTAVERQVPLEEFQGVDGPGYYFLITDRAPKPGEYPYAVRAGVGVGDLWLSVTVLARSKQTSGIADTIRALASARQLPE